MPADAGGDVAKSAASAMARGLAQEFHGMAADVTWTSEGDSGWWNGFVSYRAASSS